MNVVLEVRKRTCCMLINIPYLYEFVSAIVTTCKCAMCLNGYYVGLS